jgi:hypothetical protein
MCKSSISVVTRRALIMAQSRLLFATFCARIKDEKDDGRGIKGDQRERKKKIKDSSRVVEMSNARVAEWLLTVPYIRARDTHEIGTSSMRIKQLDSFFADLDAYLPFKS